MSTGMNNALLKALEDAIAFLAEKDNYPLSVPPVRLTERLRRVVKIAKEAAR